MKKNIGLGYTYDANGNVLAFKNSEGFWYKITRDANGNMLTYKDSNGFWSEITRDAKGNELTFKNSEGYWHEYTRDANGNMLTYKDSKGYWEEFAYDANGHQLTYKNSNGYYWSETTRDESGIGGIKQRRTNMSICLHCAASYDHMKEGTLSYCAACARKYERGHELLCWLAGIAVAILLSAFFMSMSYAAQDPLYCGPPKRDANGTIMRSAAVIREYRSIHPCPSTGLLTGACPGWALNHTRPLACGGCDSVANLTWMRNDAKKIVDGYERKIFALTPPIPDTAACVNQIVQ